LRVFLEREKVSLKEMKGVVFFIYSIEQYKLYPKTIFSIIMIVVGVIKKIKT